MAAMVQATIDNLPRQTRAKAHAIKLNALEAGILSPEKKPKARKPVLVTHIGYGSDEDTDVEPDDVFEQDVKVRNPWPQVQKLESMMAWSVWNAGQGSVKPPCPYLMRDLVVRVDNCVRNSPRTFKPEIHHWQDFDLLIQTLQEYGEGRENGFVKIKVPKEALIPSIGDTHLVGDTLTTNHRIRLEKMPRHSKSASKGIYRVKRSLNPYEDSTLTWRAVFADYERGVAESETTAASTADTNRHLERLVKSHYDRRKEDVQLRKAQQHLAKEVAQLTKQRRLKKHRQGNSRMKPKGQIGSEDRTPFDEALSSKNITPSSRDFIKSEDASVSDIHSLPRGQSVSSETSSPVSPSQPKDNVQNRNSPIPVRTFTEEEMLSLPGRRKSMTYSPNNDATHTLRLKLNVPSLDLPLTSSKIHLSGNAGVTLPLSSPVPLPTPNNPSPRYKIYMNHRGAPIHWTIIAPLSYRILIEKIHAATYTWGAGFTRPRKPPNSALGTPPACAQSLGDRGLYVCRGMLRDWGVEFRCLELREGEMLVVMPGAVEEGFWEECGVLEEGWWGGKGGGEG
ncbi:MAG: hypothetical protein Q9209_005957 [Squamulea sp. 1 TL-2023]